MNPRANRHRSAAQADSRQESTDPLEGLKSLFLDAIVPVGLYYVLNKAFGMSTVASLGWSSVVPALRTGWSAIKDRKLNALAGLILVVNVVGLALASVTGDARLMLAKDSGVSSAIGIGVLVSVAYGRPLMTTGLKPWITKGNAVRTAAWDRLMLSNPRFARAERRFSVVWGVALLAECVVRVVGAYTLPVDTMVWLGSVILGVSIVLALVASGQVAIGPMEKMVDDELAAAERRAQENARYAGGTDQTMHLGPGYRAPTTW